MSRKRVGLTAVGMEAQKHYTQAKEKKEKKLGRAVLWLLAFLRDGSLNFPCIALGQESYEM